MPAKKPAATKKSQYRVTCEYLVVAGERVEQGETVELPLAVGTELVERGRIEEAQ
jgi:hypothetical protein